MVGHGLIPTYAGNTRTSTYAASATTAHPHVCGEHVLSIFSQNSLSGSSPRMRGTRTLQGVPGGGYGLIPTYAGNTTIRASRSTWTRAHPHVCGEHRTRRAHLSTIRGSSPRMRGTQLYGTSCSSPAGLIPTYAGNTLADMGFYPHTPSFRISLEPKASINPTRFLGLSPSGSAPIPASFAPPFSWP